MAEIEDQSVVLIATAWGTKFGGINSFNYDLCRALPAAVGKGIDVVCVVASATREEIEDAQNAGVKLVCADPHDPWDSYLICKAVRKVSVAPTSWWIGHDISSRQAAQYCAEQTGAKVAVIHHMNYSAYKPFSGEDDRKGSQDQERVLQRAHRVLAVGPKLVDSAQSKVQDPNSVIELLPGLPDIAPSRPPRDTFKAITFGRLDPATDRIKQGKLAVAAFASACKEKDALGDDPQITVIGLAKSDEFRQHADLLKLAQKISRRVVAVRAWAYLEDREELFNELRRQTCAMMLSVHEGFGLVGLEAIAAEVPLILSKNSGLYQAIKRDFGRKGTGCLYEVEIRGSTEAPGYHPLDVESVRARIVEIAADKRLAKQGARELKEMLSEKWSWRCTAERLVKTLDLPKKVSEVSPEQRWLEESHGANHKWLINHFGGRWVVCVPTSVALTGSLRGKEHAGMVVLGAESRDVLAQEIAGNVQEPAIFFVPRLDHTDEHVQET